MRQGAKIPLLVVAGLVAAVLLVAGGVLLGLNPDVRGALHDVLPASFFGSSGSADDYALQQEVLDKLESNFYKPVDAAALEDDAIDGMVAGLGDPYTVYWDPEEYATYMERASEQYSGVGMTVQMKDNLVTIVSTFKGSPAELAGIAPRDIILAVDGVSTEGQNLGEVVAGIKGTEGTTVTLTIYRPPASTTTTTVAGTDDGGGGAEDSTAEPTADISNLPPGGETKDYTLTRKTLEVPVAETEMLDVEGETVALISLSDFFDKSADQLRSEVERAIESDGASAIILDLRGNIGGFLEKAVDAASIFIPEGEVIVSQEGLHSPERVYYALGDAYADIPLIVLVDKYTASAAEIVSGALQDHERATLVGETTFSKGLVQSILPLSNGGALKVTTAVYFTPDGRDINDTGIIPDVVAPDDPATEVDEGLQAAERLIAGTTTATN
jgi:carboxyl-terminal processing protease